MYRFVKITKPFIVIIPALILRSYVIYLYGTMCGVNVFDWNSWSHIFYTKSLLCDTFEIIIKHSSEIILSLVTALGMYVMNRVGEFNN